MAEEEIGHVTHFFPKISVAVIDITAGSLKVGETIRIKGHTSDFTQTVESLQRNRVPEADKGPGLGQERSGDKVYRAEKGAHCSSGPETEGEKTPLCV
jgi:putative protease